jgi:hypothetical protein
MKKIVFEGKENEKLSLKLNLPTNFYFSDETKITIGLFEQGKGWTKNGIFNAQADLKDLTIRCEISRLLPISILLPKCTDCPYKSFFLRCTSTEVALLDLESIYFCDI